MSSTVNNQATAEPVALRERLMDQVGKPLQWPEPGMTLNAAASARSTTSGYPAGQKIATPYSTY